MKQSLPSVNLQVIFLRMCTGVTGSLIGGYLVLCQIALALLFYTIRDIMCVGIE